MDIFDVSDLEITNPEQDLVVTEDVSQEAYDDFAAMWANENKGTSPDQSLGLEEPEFDENGHEVEAGEDGDVDFDDINDELESHADDVHERTVQENLEQYQEFANNFEELPDDITFNVNGAEFTKADLVAVANQNEVVKGTFGHISELQRDLKGAVDAMQYQIHAAQTETSKEKQVLLSKLNNPAIPQIEKVGMYEKLQNLEQRDQFLTQNAQQFAQQAQAAKHKSLEARISSVSQQLSMKYSPEQINSTLSYITDSGIQQDEMFELSSKPFFEMAKKAKAYDELHSKSVAKATPKKAAKSPKRPARKQVMKKTSNADQLIKAWESGQSQNQAALDSAVFANLED